MQNNSNGQTAPANLPNPTPEYPTDSQLKAYGDLMFLYMRIPKYNRVPMRIIRLNIQPPIDLNMNKVFYKDGYPRAAMTWALLGPTQEKKFLSGEGLQPSDWLSGRQLWIMDILAPYGRGSGGDILRWLRKNVSTEHNIIRFPRVNDKLQLTRVVESIRKDEKIWSVKSRNLEYFLNQPN